MNNYSNRLGSGAFGVVYKGWCPNGIKIIVKVLNRNPNSKKVEEQFMAEVGTIGKTYHINLDRTPSGYRGTPGYSAPEFLMHNYPITHKCDVYSFGMLLFEIARRKRNTNTNFGSDSIDWFPKKAWEEMIMVALWCVQDSPDSRPLMSTIVKMLEGGIEILSPRNPFRYLYGSHAGDVATGTSDVNSYSTTARTNSSQYENTTPLMRKYEIQIATI
ncbi:hypothetical protein MKX01_022868 [Papaver californicum]|nr:hypothetical protein MKX01_022868 [Papaver californicum]